MAYSRSVSALMTVRPRRVISASCWPRALMVSTQPLMLVSGVRSSWLTEEMKSFFIRSVSARASDIWLMVAHRRPISSL